MRARNWAAAQEAIDAARALSKGAASLERLAAEVRLAQGKADESVRIYRSAMERYPLNRALVYGYADALLQSRQFDTALRFSEEQLRVQPFDIRLHRQRAGAYAGLGKNAMQHRALAEVFALQGQTAGAIGQLELAIKAGDANFYEMSAIDARLRELKIRRLEELKDKN